MSGLELIVPSSVPRATLARVSFCSVLDVSSIASATEPRARGVERALGVVGNAGNVFSRARRVRHHGASRGTRRAS